ncbi:adrenocorticotropic hormone receptor-like [Dendronephthya gigantea]|uniref:adrenocorticotropic hormone receptor-like n=1 Tax=Dendronephthya gigantea TaxID=151771 RepID=UPI00106BC2F8|nr:adrenocorticotropic hormone receptor-like [Dendronephthya gigantea]
MSLQSLQAEFDNRCWDTGPPKELSFLTLSFSFFFTLLNIPGNTLVIIVVAKDPQRNLRTPFNYFMCNLALADLIVGLICDPISVYIHWKEVTDSEVTELDYQINHLSYFISCTASVLSLAAVAVERYLAIRDPHNYRSKCTGKRILLTIAGIWLFSLSLPWIYLSVGFIAYAFIFANSAVAVAVFICCFTYGLFLRAFKKRSRNSEEHPAEDDNHRQPNDQNEDTLSRRNANTRRENAEQLEQRITKMFLIVLLALLCCYVPSTVLIYALGFCKSCSCETLHWFKDLQHLFVLANSSVNFFCYAFRSPRFLSAFKTILKCRRGNVSHEGVA